MTIKLVTTKSRPKYTKKSNPKANNLVLEWLAKIPVMKCY